MRASPDHELRCRSATASASAVPGPAASKRMVMLKRARRTVHAAVQAARIAATGTISWQAKSARATERGEAPVRGGLTEGRHQQARKAEKMAKARLRPGAAHDLSARRPPLNSQTGRKIRSGTDAAANSLNALRNVSRASGLMGRRKGFPKPNLSIRPHVPSGVCFTTKRFRIRSLKSRSRQRQIPSRSTPGPASRTATSSSCCSALGRQEEPPRG